MITNLKKLTLGLSVMTLTVGGVACAQSPANPPSHERPRMDADGDGNITRTEAQARAEAMFNRFDVNKDGKLEQSDRQMAHQQKRERMFDRLDTNKDGSISKTEFMADRTPKAAREGKAHRGHRGMKGWGGHGRGGMRAMHGADVDKNRVVTRAEFMDAAMKRFDMQDANKDGTVTKEERAAAHQAMRAKWQARKADKMADKNAAN